jgi:hypothetical protein
MISPAIAGNDSRCGIALRVFLGELSAISCQYPYPIGELSVKRGLRKLGPSASNFPKMRLYRHWERFGEPTMSDSAIWHQLTLTKASLNWRPVVPDGCSKRILNTIALISPFETQQML